MKKILPLICFHCISVLLYSQDSCFRVPFTPVYIIGNPTFDLQGMPCHSGYIGEYGPIVPSWYVPTTEMPTAYLNSCTNFKLPDSAIVNATNQVGKIIHSDICLYPIVPQPVPGNGSGVVAVSDFDYPGDSTVFPYYKSYVSTCLNGMLKKDSLYELDFYVGFGKQDTEFLSLTNSTLAPQFSLNTEKFSIFGLPDCSDIDNPLPIVGCPTYGLNWVLLGTCTVSGARGSWVKTNIVFTPTEDISSIAIGPSCDLIPANPEDVISYMGMSLSTRYHSYFLDSLQLYEAPVILPMLSMQGSFCDQSVTLEVHPANFYSGSTILWYDNGNLIPSVHDSTITINRSTNTQGIYRSTIENSNLCISSDSVAIDWMSPPNASVLGMGDTILCAGDSLLLNAYTDSLSTYKWQDGSTDSIYQVTNAGTYSVNISNACGTVQSSKNVMFNQCNYDVIVPNAFTPNGDGKNDIFKVSYSHLPTGFKMQIYNRYGQLLFSSSDPAQGWDGYANGIKQQAGAYVWMIEYTKQNHPSVESIKGAVMLIR